MTSTPEDVEPAEPDFYTTLAATLHGVADDIAGLAGRGLPEGISVGMTIQPWSSLDEDTRIATVDAFGVALFGRDGDLREMSDHTFHYDVRGERGPVRVSAFVGVTSPKDKALAEENARLRAELDALRQTGGDRS